MTACLLGLIWILYVRASFAGILAMLFMTVPLFFWSRRQRGRAGVAVIVLIAATVAIFVWLQDTRRDLDPGGLPGTIPYWLIEYQRQVIFKFTLDLAAQSPWFGHGINVINFLPGADTRIPGLGELTYIPGFLPVHGDLEDPIAIEGASPPCQAAWTITAADLPGVTRTITAGSHQDPG